MLAVGSPTKISDDIGQQAKTFLTYATDAFILYGKSADNPRELFVLSFPFCSLVCPQNSVLVELTEPEKFQSGLDVVVVDTTSTNTTLYQVLL